VNLVSDYGSSARSLPRGRNGVVLPALVTLHYLLHFARDPVGCGTALHRRHGPLVAHKPIGNFPRGGRKTVLAVGAEYNKAVLNDPQTWHSVHLTLRGPNGSALNRLGSNVVSLNGPQQRYYRKLVSQPVRSTKLAEMGDDVGRLVESIVATWPHGEGDLWQRAKHLMRSVSVALLFGGAQERGTSLANLIENVLVLSASPRARLCPWALPGTVYRRLMQDAEELERSAIDFARAKRSPGNGCDLASLIANTPDETGAAPSDRLIGGHIPILFASTYETCQTILTWTVFLLAQHPRIARDLCDEIANALAGGPATLARVAELPLLDAVVRESMRILPPVPYQVRAATQPTQLGDFEILAGWHAIISPYLTNRVPGVFEEPSRFKPERWSRIAPSAFEYLSISAGPRVCPGAKFGISVVKVALAAILSRFRISVVNGARIDRRIAVTMAPRDGLAVVLHPPDGAWMAAPVTGQIRDMVDLTAG
jgi:cytochrome P450